MRPRNRSFYFLYQYIYMGSLDRQSSNPDSESTSYWNYSEFLSKEIPAVLIKLTCRFKIEAPHQSAIIMWRFFIRLSYLVVTLFYASVFCGGTAAQKDSGGDTTILGTGLHFPVGGNLFPNASNLTKSG